MKVQGVTGQQVIVLLAALLFEPPQGTFLQLHSKFWSLSLKSCLHHPVLSTRKVKKKKWISKFRFYMDGGEN